jgi:hypothetical protein
LQQFGTVGENHDDHQAAGALATEPFDLTGDSTKFPERVSAPRYMMNRTEGLHLPQPKKLYYATDGLRIFVFTETVELGESYPVVAMSLALQTEAWRCGPCK